MAATALSTAVKYWCKWGEVKKKIKVMATVNLAAAAVANNGQISSWRDSLLKANELFRVDRLSSVIAHPDKTLADQGKKCLLLNPSIKADAPDTWGPVLRDGVQKNELGVVPFELKLDYNYWTYHDIMSSILPENFHGDIPAGFNTAGHVAHLNLRDHFKPYKKLVAEVLLDKNPHIKTVINKVDNVGAESEFRTFQYEVLAGEDNLNVSVAEGGCVFEFDYAKVYWNSKLETEHRRIINLFKPGKVVCDVMAGIGPFAVPAGKKGVFVWANDMNPESHACLEKAIKKNKVQQYVRPFCQDGRTFIHYAADSVLEASQAGACALIPGKKPPRSKVQPAVTPEPTKIPLPPTISHFVMNLPATATTFVHHYKGLYAGKESLFEPHTKAKLPMVHVHCFGVKVDNKEPLLDVVKRVEDELGVPMRLGTDPETNDGEVAVHDVRDVAPAKRMYCASFRIPREVAFAPRE